MTLQSSVAELKGVGPAVAEKLNKRGINTLADFLFLLPSKYQDRTRITTINDALPGQSVQIEAQVESAKIVYGRQRQLLVTVYDSSGGKISLRFFNFSKAQQAQLRPQTRLLIYGLISISGHTTTMLHPEYKILKSSEKIYLSERLTPVYPTIHGIGSARISQWVAVALEALANEALLDFNPTFLQKNQLSSLAEALLNIHQPEIGLNIEQVLSENSPYLARLVLDELLAKQMVLLKKKAAAKQNKAVKIPVKKAHIDALTKQLPFTLTKAQQRCIAEINSDINKAVPMHRLLQGDVGSGKTLVALTPALQVVKAGYQAVMMAPTEILAEQHYKQARNLLADLGVNVVWLAGKMKAAEKKAAIEQIANGEAQLIIGTHALFQADIEYQSLAMVIIDEQHRFGVEQRLLLREKNQKIGYLPHLLVMSATPIPRTLAMSFYADLDTSIIDELPANRQPIETILLANNRRLELVEHIHNVVSEGRQVYWVCALIDESEVLQAEAAENLYQQLQGLLPNLQIGLLHSRLKSDDKETIIANFKANKMQVLVATTVIEVGVDIPNASLMVIENSERFGLAQLHQLRGRVGRGQYQSYCVLMYQPPLSENAKKRLNVIRNEVDGFAIAKADLSIRGAGEVIGTKQTGDVSFRIVDMERDEKWIEKAYTLAEKLLAEQPDMANQIIERWVGKAEDFIHV